MRILFCVFIAAAVFTSCKEKDKKQSTDETVPIENKVQVDSLLLTDSSWGWVHSSASFDELKKSYGEVNVKDERICGAECIDSVDVTIIYPGSNREFIVYWQDSFYHRQIGFIRCYAQGAPYHTAGGIKIGTTLTELLQMNGKPIAFSGFGWDYGGGIISLNDGLLDKSKVRFNLDLSENATGDNAVYGDTELNSDMPAVKKFQDKIRVSELFLSFNR